VSGDDGGHHFKRNAIGTSPPPAGLLAQVLAARYLDHRPLSSQEAVFERAGVVMARSTWAPVARSLRCELAAAGECVGR
jgi:transposase